MINTLRSARNPQDMILNLANRNPNVANVLSELQASGGDAKSLFYKKAKDMNVDPDSILSMLK